MSTSGSRGPTIRAPTLSTTQQNDGSHEEDLLPMTIFFVFESHCTVVVVDRSITLFGAPKVIHPYYYYY
jgi:hypothetical protein